MITKKKLIFSVFYILCFHQNILISTDINTNFGAKKLSKSNLIFTNKELGIVCSPIDDAHQYLNNLREIINRKISLQEDYANKILTCQAILLCLENLKTKFYPDNLKKKLINLIINQLKELLVEQRFQCILKARTTKRLKIIKSKKIHIKDHKQQFQIIDAEFIDIVIEQIESTNDKTLKQIFINLLQRLREEFNS